MSPRPDRGRGAALLEATVALGIVAMVAAAGFAAFSAANRASAEASRDALALALAQSMLDAHLHPAFVAAAADAPETREGARDGLAWRLEAGPHDGPATGLALARLEIVVRDRGTERARLATLRAVRPPPAGRGVGP
jgi:Tfp pilus assembly protein PilX